MFKNKELNSIDKSYFNIIQLSLHTVTIQSKNTKHFWHILQQEYPTFSSCIIYHRHNEYYSYHLHGHAPTLKRALIDIQKHDDFQIRVRKRIG